jgi:hypothetical protein
VRLPSVAARPVLPPISEAPSATSAAPSCARPVRAAFRYVRRLWSGDLPLSRVFWIDMFLVGTLVNLLSLIAAIVLFAGNAPLGWGVAAFLAHIPYSLLLFTGVWRSAARAKSEWSSVAQAAALAWLIAAFVI